jgi:hypothetical protein
LMRFAFDPKTVDRKKSGASIRFGKSVTLGAEEFELKAIITHQGSSVSVLRRLC